MTSCFFAVLAVVVTLIYSPLPVDSETFCRRDIDCNHQYDCLDFWLHYLCVCDKGVCYPKRHRLEPCSVNRQCVGNHEKCQKDVCDCDEEGGYRWLRTRCAEKHWCDFDSDCLVYGTNCTEQKCYNPSSVPMAFYYTLGGIALLILICCCIGCVAHFLKVAIWDIWTNAISLSEWTFSCPSMSIVVLVKTSFLFGIWRSRHWLQLQNVSRWLRWWPPFDLI